MCRRFYYLRIISIARSTKSTLSLETSIQRQKMPLALTFTPTLTLVTLLQSKTQRQKALSPNAGVTKGVTSPAAHRGIW